MEIGRLCVKLAGRDAGRIAVVVDNLEKNFVLIDGNVRRRKCNALHLEPLDEVIKIKKNASHTDVASEFKKLKLDVWTTKPKKKTKRQKKQRKEKIKAPEVKKEAKAEKKEESKKEAKAEEPKAEKKEKPKAEAKEQSKKKALKVIKLIF